MWEVYENNEALSAQSKETLVELLVQAEGMREDDEV